MERLLGRISISEYRDEFILKGGMLVSTMVGLTSRLAMDIDITIKGEIPSINEVEYIIATIIVVSVDGNAEFHIKQASKIMDGAEYPDVRVSTETEFDSVRTSLKINTPTGDVITLCEMRYSFRLMLENRSIGIWAYNLGTISIKKLETVISRATTNTCIRGFYDLYILRQLHGRGLISVNLHIALMAAVKKRGTEEYLPDTPVVFDGVEADLDMEKQWKPYQKKFPYVADLIQEVVTTSARDIYKRIKAQPVLGT